MVSLFVLALPVKATAPEEPPLSTKEQMVSYAEEVSIRHGVNPSVVKAVITCESQWNPKALGDSGHSRGLVQIHDQYHDIPDEVAYDPRFAINFLVSELKQGNGDMWTCFRNLDT